MRYLLGFVFVFLVAIHSSFCQTPTITSTNPTSASPGATVTINGTNFSTTPSDNVVYFGAVRATVNSSTNSQLSVTVPYGATYQPISVNVNGLTAFSSSSFVQTFSSLPIILANSFSSKVDFGSISGGYSVALGDLDGDGKPDVVISSNNLISIFQNISTIGSITASSFGAAINLPAGNTAKGISLADLDGDNKLDIVFANYGSNAINIFQNISTAGTLTSSSFGAKVTLSTGSSSTPLYTTVADLNQDGKPEIISVNCGVKTMSVFGNLSTVGTITSSSFQTRVDFATGTFPFTVEAQDLDGDGEPDLVVANETNSSFSVFRNTGATGAITSSSLATRVDFSTGAGSYPICAKPADIDGDGLADLIVADYALNKISLYRNTSSISSISFSSPVDFATGNNPFSVSVGNLDGNTKPDIVVPNWGSNTVSVFRNKSVAGSFSTSSLASKVDFTAGTYPSYAALGDIDGDGKPEIISTNQNSTAVSVFQNTVSAPIPPPVITSFSPASGSIETTIVLQGSGFDTTPANNLVTIGGLNAKVLSSTATSISAVVPIGATSGSISVTVLEQTGTSTSDFTILQPPTLTSFSPKSGMIGTSVVITGTGFSAVAANNTVFFGATKATVTSASSTQLTVKVPSGATYQPISVGVNNLYAYSSVPFLVTFPSANGISGGVFPNKVDFPTGAGTNPKSTAIGDLDGDGKPDLVVVNASTNNVSVFRNINSATNITTNSFDAPLTFPTGTTPVHVAIGDLDGDGLPDLATANEGGNISILKNTSTSGSISFATKVDFGAGGFPTFIAIGDIDGNGKPDLVLASDGNLSISVFRNTSTAGVINSGSFQKINFSVNAFPISVAIGDLDNDGKPDLAVSHNDSQTLSVLRNTSSFGTISFAPKVDLPTLEVLDAVNVVIGDLDGDNKAEIVTGNYSDSRISIFKNNSTSGTIAFNNRLDLPVSGCRWVSLIDFDGDGKLDLSEGISVRRNITKSGVIDNNSFTGFVTLPQLTSLSSVTSVGDLNGDAKADLVLTDPSGNKVSVFENEILPPLPSPPVPVISGFSPSSGPIASSVAITGVNFSNVPTNNTVFFGATQATVTSATSTQLTVKVPAGATHLPISVEVNGLMAQSSNPFIVTFPSNQEIDANSFAVYVDVVEGGGNNSPDNLIIKDLDGDGKPDLIAANYNSNSISIIRNVTTPNAITSSSFATRIEIGTSDIAFNLAVDDLDGDGKPDIVVGVGQGFGVFKNQSVAGSLTSASFAPRVDFYVSTGGASLGNSNENITIGDLTGDGKPEIITRGDQAISIFKNTTVTGQISPSSFNQAVNLSSVADYGDLCISDLDGDGKQDIAVVTNSLNQVSVFRNKNSNGEIDIDTFAPKVDFTTYTGPSSLSVSDLDSDGKPELIVGAVGHTSILKNLSTPGTIASNSFATKVDFATLRTSNIAIGDLDGDGKPDMAMTSHWSGSYTGFPLIFVFKNKTKPGEITTSSFAPSVGFTNNRYSNEFTAIGDLDGDGKPELAVLGAGGVGLADAISILKNIIPLPPTITNLNPSSGIVGTTVTITGTNFSNTITTNKVSFNGTPAVITSSTSTTIVTSVPVGATTGPVTISVNGGIIVSSPGDFTVIGSGVSAPVATTATSISQTGFAANWNAVTGATSYQIDISTDSFSTFLTGYNSKIVTGTSQVVTGLTAGTSYKYRVRAITSSGTSANSNVISVTTLPSAVPAPVATAATSVSSTGFIATWNSVSGATSYQLDISTDNFTTFLTGYNSKIVTGTSQVVTGLTAGTSYKYRVRAITSSGTSANSNVISATTLPSTVPAPVATAATSVSSTGFIATWNSVSGATSYQLDISTDNFTTFLTGYNSKIETGTSQVVTGLTVGISYQYRVRAITSSGTSANSNVITVTTLPSAVSAPVATAASSVSSTSFTANWNSVAGATSYQLDVSSDNFASFLTGYNSKIETGTSQVVSGLTLGTTYQYRVRASIASVNSTNSNIITVATSSKSNQTITFNSIHDVTIGDPAITLTASSSSGLPISFVSKITPAALTGASFKIVLPGRDTITASQSGNANYFAAVPVIQTFCINPAKPVVTMTNDNNGTVTLTSSTKTGNQWYLNGAPISGATGQTLDIVKDPSEYTVRVKVDDCLSAPSSIKIPTTVVTGDIKTLPTPLTLYPNPTHDFIFIKGLGEEVASASVIDLVGQHRVIELEAQGDNIFKGSISDLANGLYILQVSTDGQMQQIKFIKQ